MNLSLDRKVIRSKLKQAIQMGLDDPKGQSFRFCKLSNSFQNAWGLNRNLIFNGSRSDGDQARLNVIRSKSAAAAAAAARANGSVGFKLINGDRFQYPSFTS